MRMKGGTIWAALALTMLGACSKDSTGPDNDDVMTEIEYDAFTGFLNEVMGAAHDADVDATGKLDGALACSFIGDVGVTGQYTLNAERTQLGTDFTYNFRKCRQGSDGGVFVINGIMRELGTEKVDTATSTYTWDMKLSGTLNWSLKDRAGACDVDATRTYKSVADSVLTDNWAGKVCGQSIDTTL
jgi:hypothetical protein